MRESIPEVVGDAAERPDIADLQTLNSWSILGPTEEFDATILRRGAWLW